MKKKKKIKTMKKLIMNILENALHLRSSRFGQKEVKNIHKRQFKHQTLYGVMLRNLVWRVLKIEIRSNAVSAVLSPF